MLAIDGLARRPVAIPGATDIGQFIDKLGNRRSKERTQLLQRDLGILDNIVKPCGCTCFRIVGNCRHQRLHRLQVNFIGLVIVFAPMIDAPMGGNGKCLRPGEQAGFCLDSGAQCHLASTDACCKRNTAALISWRSVLSHHP